MLAASEGRALARLQRNAAQRRVTGCSLLHLAAQAQWPAARSLAAGRWRSPCLRDAVTRARAARRCRAVRYEVADASPSSALDGLPRSLTIVTGGSRGEQQRWPTRHSNAHSHPSPLQAPPPRRRRARPRRALGNPPTAPSPLATPPGLGRRIAEALLTSGDPSTGHAAACPGGHDVLLLASNPSALNAAVADLAAAAAFGTLRAGGGGASGAGGAWGTGGGDSSSGGGVSTPKLRLRGIAVDLGDLDRLEGFSRALVTASAQVRARSRCSERECGAPMHVQAVQWCLSDRCTRQPPWQGRATRAAPRPLTAAHALQSEAKATRRTHRARAARRQGGLLPADPASYASVLLVHNAGQTGDLVFTWDQSAGNIRRQASLYPRALWLTQRAAARACCRKKLAPSSMGAQGSRPLTKRCAAPRARRRST